MLLVFGSINLDEVFAVPRLPAAGDTVRAGAGWTELGGKGALQAIAAARDGTSVALAGAIGRDAPGQQASRTLAREGINPSRVARLQAATGRAAIAVTTDGHTSVVANAGANLLARASLVADRWLGPRTTLLVQLDCEPEETAALISRARARGARIVLNLSPERMIATSALKQADLIVCNEPEMAWAGERLGTGNNPASLHAALGVACVRMMGVQGADGFSRDGYLHMPAFTVQMRDTTGAGDCFVGVLAGALARGAHLNAALRRAAVAAALSAKHAGNKRSFPFRRDIDAALTDAPEPSTKQDEVLD